ncbi:nucleoid-associated protein [Sulfuricurvum sp.]|uniref:nucleoid-associated protein n=1 Tax=Sulfuricurvum sp. TaxID=2025608 RepID=UPI003BB7A5C5
MILNSVIIHEIRKEANTTNTATLYLSNSVLDVSNEYVLKIVTSLEESFSRKTLKRAKFSEDGFKEDFQDFTNIDIMNFSNVLTTKLKNNINGISQAKGGYLVFARYTTTQDFLAIFLVRNTEGSKLIPSAGSWDLDSTQYLDVEHFAMGTKINLSILNSESDDRYISLVRGNTDISHYFEAWIGLDDPKQENKDAQALYNIANQIDLPNGMTRDSLKRTIFDYAKSSTGKIVNLRDLSTYIFQDENYITNYCETNNVDIDGEFKLTGANLSRFYKVSVKANNIELTFPRSSFNPNEIEIIDGQVVIHSEELAQQIQSALNSNIDVE